MFLAQFPTIRLAHFLTRLQPAEQGMGYHAA